MMKINLKVVAVVGLCILHSVWSQEKNGNLPGNDLDTAENIEPADSRNVSVDHIDFMSRFFTSIGKKTDDLSRSYKLGRCPVGWLRYGESCYHFSRFNANWFESLMFCYGTGGYLAEINSYSENSYIKQQVGYRKDTFWLGGTDLVKEYHWVWATSQRGITINNWYRNQPDNYRGKEHCMEIYYKSEKWSDRYCRESRKFICERDLK